MARSTYIYLVMLEEYETDVVAAFTVKHEALSAIERYKKTGGRADIGLYRVRDGGTFFNNMEPVK